MDSVAKTPLGHSWAIPSTQSAQVVPDAHDAALGQVKIRKNLGQKRCCSLVHLNLWRWFACFSGLLPSDFAKLHGLENRSWLVVGPPLWKIWVRQLGWWLFPILLGKYNPNIPNHQPDDQFVILKPSHFEHTHASEFHRLLPAEWTCKLVDFLGRLSHSYGGFLK